MSIVLDGWLRAGCALLLTTAVACGGATSSAPPSPDGAPPPSDSGGPTDDGGSPSVDGAPPEGDASDAATPTPYVVNEGSSIHFAPSNVDATRYTNGCNADGGPKPDDLFSITAVGSKIGPPPYTLIEVNFRRPVTVGSPLTLTPSPFTAPMPMSSGGQSALLGDASHMVMSISLGAKADEIDGGAFDQVVVTVVALPANDGDPLIVRVHVHFVDAKVLDETFSAPLGVSLGGCAAG